MKEKSLVEFLINQIGDLLVVIQGHQGPVTQNVTPDVVAELERLEQAMLKFEEINKEAYKDANIDIERLKSETYQSEQIPPKDMQVLKRAQEIEKEARALQRAYQSIIAEAKQETQVDDPKRKELRDRRKRYKPMGGDKNWIPM